jgi:hypothetical protein
MSDIRFNRWLHQSGTGGVYQDSSGRVGIGTSVPTSALDIQSGSIKIGSNTLSSSGVSTFTTVNATTVNATSLVGVSTAGITTAYIGSVNDGPISGFRNLITNGEMVLDQRNSGSAVTINSDGFGGRLFPVDRFPVQRAGTIVITAQQDTVAPPNFQNSVKLTVTTADSSVAATDYAFINHRLEGYTTSPLRYGTSAAKQATLSFWVRSSITGTYCIGISNYADNRAHVKEYTINSANTWEYKTITITGETTGTWEKTNSGGMNISWTLLAGSDYQATANTWHTSVKLATSSQTQWGSTSSATFYLTGVQLELGTTASIFERRSYGQELSLCERYYQIKEYNGGTVNMYPGSTNGYFTIPLSPLMRTAPSVVTYDTAYQASGFIYYNGGSTAVTYGNNQAPTIGAVSSVASRTSGNFSAGEVCGHTYVRIRASAEL